MKLQKTVERIVPTTFKTKEEYLLYLRHVFAYEEFIDHLGETDLRVLEIGFGEGYGTHMIHQATGEVVALDVNQKAVDYANYTYGSDTCHFIKYDGDRIPFDDNSFDAVVSFQVIEHVEDDSSYLREINRILKPKRTAHLTTPNRETRLKTNQKPWNPFHKREYSTNQLRALASPIFSQVRIFGVRGDEDVEQTEHARVCRKLSFYKLLPDFLKRMVSGEFMKAYDTSSFYLSEDESDKGMDLFVMLVK